MAIDWGSISIGISMGINIGFFGNWEGAVPLI